MVEEDGYLSQRPNTAPKNEANSTYKSGIFEEVG
jgi:hypothetical protein